MNHQHLFLFEKGIWLGQGTIKLSEIEEELQFHMKWKVEPQGSTGIVDCHQEIHIVGVADAVLNEFQIFDIEQGQFSLMLENYALGKIQGKGLIKEKILGWELKDLKVGFEGFEFYERKKDGTYFLHAEYMSGESQKTEIQGKIWLQENAKAKGKK
jgi:hypothetical protein